VECEGREERGQGGGDGASYHNVPQAQAAVRALEQVLRDSEVTSCAILTPYNAQVRLLKSMLRGANKQAMLDSGRLTISSVDGFQGREADAVIFSTVRCNAQQRLGFVSDARRMNVALTRARRGLIVIGSSRTLCGDGNWDSWLRWLANASRN
jgi:regulator of nonsense transcripts 1